MCIKIDVFKYDGVPNPRISITGGIPWTSYNTDSPKEAGKLIEKLTEEMIRGHKSDTEKRREMWDVRCGICGKRRDGDF